MEYCKDNNIPLIIIKYDENLTEILNIFFYSRFIYFNDDQLYLSI